MTLTLTNARIIDPEAGTETLGAVRIEDGVIAEILPASSDGIDCKGKCLAPGIIDIGVKNLMIMITGDEDKIDALCDLLLRFGIQELVRTGKISLMRGAKTIQGNDKAV